MVKETTEFVPYYTGKFRLFDALPMFSKKNRYSQKQSFILNIPAYLHFK